AVVVGVVHRRHRADVGAALGVGVDVDPQVGVFGDEAVTARFHLRAGGGLHAFARCAGIAILLDRQRRVERERAGAREVGLGIGFGADAGAGGATGEQRQA